MTPAPPSRPAGVMAGFTKVGGLRPPQSGRVVGAEGAAAGKAGGPGWRGRRISQAPQLGRTGWTAHLPPVYAARLWRSAPNRGSYLPARSAAPRASTPSGGEERREGIGRTEPRSVRAGGNRGSERAWASRRDSVVVTARGGDPGWEETTTHGAASPGGCVAVQMASAQAKHWQWGYRQRRQALRRESAASSIIKLMLRVAFSKQLLACAGRSVDLGAGL